MAKRPPRPKKTPWIVPHLVVKDPVRAIAFYKEAFGFQPQASQKEPGGRIAHAELTYQDCLITLGSDRDFGAGQAGNGKGSPINLYIYCEDVDALAARAAAAGATVLAAPKDEFWGDRLCRLADPDGHQWIFATNILDYDPYSTVRE